ncbi:acetyl-CoA carboxylase biotin carboxyl carrier protein [Sphaerisporangium corydalis]|uniref:Biotin carboxyl carrier protein of acetyl-CoA carboxylase n=1 Tax=Sphaerisporangium corydalis TaxID=1441875 RepID=A0ABV9EFT0_9ACTN|nr:acetyl-CoA carboxylase biotin carboxyl carrier protein [Sphaerisporangium corydalis]
MSERAGHTPTLEELWRHATGVIDAGAGPVRRIKLSAGETSVEIEWPEHVGAAAYVPLAAVATVPASLPAAVHGVADLQPDPAAHQVCAPLVGTFYRAPSPGAKPFVEVGDTVVAGQRVAIVEAMKLMNGVEADRDGLVTAILVEDATSVEYGQPLITIDPMDE